MCLSTRELTRQQKLRRNRTLTKGGFPFLTHRDFPLSNGFPGSTILRTFQRLAITRGQESPTLVSVPNSGVSTPLRHPNFGIRRQGI